MSGPPAGQPRAAVPAHWAGETRGALGASAAMLPFVLSFGTLVFGAAGAPATALGLQASVLAVAIGPLLMSLAGRALLPAASPSASTSLILGSVVLALLRDPGLQPTAEGGLARLVLCTAATVALAGGLLLALGLLRAGRVVRHIPHPVLAGFMNGVALLIVVSQLPALLGLPADALAREGWAALRQVRPGPLVLATSTALLALWSARRLPQWPAPLVALLAASGAAAAVAALGVDLRALGIHGLEAGAGGGGQWLPPMPAWTQGGALALLGAHATDILVGALLLALIGGLESVLNLAAVDTLVDARTDVDRELVALGLANLVLGALGGLFVVYLRLRAVASFSAGGRSWRSLWLGSALLTLLFALALPWIGQVPVAVVAGIVVMLAWGLVDPWSRQRVRQWAQGDRSPALRESLGIVALVCGVTLAWGFVAGVGAGVLVSAVLFIRSLERSLLRLRYLASEIPSRRLYPSAVESRLAPLRGSIEVLELEGALFFGNVQRLLDIAEAAGAGRRVLILDLRRISTVDASGAMGLHRLQAQLQRQGRTLLLAGVAEGSRHGQVLSAHGVASQGGWWPDADRALEAAERRLLEDAGVALAGLRVEPAHSGLFEGLTAEQAGRMLTRMGERELAAGERLFSQGEPGDALYLLESGSVSMVDRERSQRFVSFSAGMCFGETAVLDPQGRTADALADEASRLRVLPAAELQQLGRQDPAIAATLYRNLARHLSERLRAAAAAWRRAAS